MDVFLLYTVAWTVLLSGPEVSTLWVPGGMQPRNQGPKESVAFRPAIQAMMSLRNGCPGLKSKTAKMVCSHKTERASDGIDCTKKVPAGTKVTFTCPNNTYMVEKYDTIICGAVTKKKWSNKVVRCKAEKTTTASTTTVSEETTTVLEETTLSPDSTLNSDDTTASVDTSSALSSDTSTPHLAAATTNTSNVGSFNTNSNSNTSSDSTTNSGASTVASKDVNGTSTAGVGYTVAESTTAVSNTAATTDTAISTAATTVTSTTTAAATVTAITTAATTTATTTTAATSTLTTTTATTTTATTTTATTVAATTTAPPLYVNVANVGLIKKCPPKSWTVATADCAADGAVILTTDTTARMDYAMTYAANSSVYFGAAVFGSIWSGMVNKNSIWYTPDGALLTSNPIFKWNNLNCATGPCCYVLKTRLLQAPGSINCLGTPTLPYICLKP